LLIGSQYVAACLGFLTSIVAARALGPTDYGVAVLVMTYPTLLWSIVDTKSSSVITRYIASFRATGRKEELRSICKLGYGVDLLISIVAFALVSATSWWATRFMPDTPHLVWLMIVYAASFPFSSLAGTSWAVLSSWQRFRWLAGFQILDKGITFVVVMALLLVGLGAPAIVLGSAVGHITQGLVVVAAAAYVLYRDEIGPWWKASLGDVAPLRKELSAFFGWSYLIVTFSGLIGQVPVLLLGHLRDPRQAGFYRLATNFTIVGSYLETSLGRIAYPIISARWSMGDRENLKNTLKRWTLWGGIPVGFGVLLTIVFIPILIPVVFGTAYSPMVVGAQVMMVGTAVSAASFLLTQFYFASGRIDLWTKAYGLYTALVIGLGAYCIQRWGFVGLANVVGLGKVLFTALLVVIFVTVWQKSK
jgi:O-antigen/teichoic acid export membrane protein